jgi:hypothetical protein
MERKISVSLTLAPTLPLTVADSAGSIMTFEPAIHRANGGKGAYGKPELPPTGRHAHLFSLSILASR